MTPPATTANVSRDGTTADESEVENDEKQIEVREGSIYGDLLDLKETIVHSVIQILLTEMSVVAPNGPTTSEVTPDTSFQTNRATI